MIVHDPWIRLHQRGLTFRAIFVVLTGACLFACMVSRFIPGLSPFWQTLTTASSIFIGWVFVLATFWFLRARNVLKQRRQQQQKLLAGDVGQLAREQPSPNQHALPLPTKIALRNRISVSTYLLYGALVFVALLLALRSGRSSRSLPRLMMLIIPLMIRLLQPFSVTSPFTSPCFYGSYGHILATG